MNLYLLLRWLRGYDLKELWQRDYERALNHGVSPRKEQAEIYDHIQKNDSFP